MDTNPNTQTLEAEIDALLSTLTKETQASSARIRAQLHSLESDTDMLESGLTASGRDIADFMEQQGKEMDTLIEEERKEIAAEPPDGI